LDAKATLTVYGTTRVLTQYGARLLSEIIHLVCRRGEMKELMAITRLLYNGMGDGWWTNTHPNGIS